MRDACARNATSQPYMYARLDDELLDHPKIFTAGDLLGDDGPAIALGLYSVALMWCNRHLTDGHLPIAVVKKWPHVHNPVAVADALVRAGLWEKNGSGFTVHDFGDKNFSAAAVKAKRRKDAAAKRKRDADRKRAASHENTSQKKRSAKSRES